jgi:hypothetical protein
MAPTDAEHELEIAARFEQVFHDSFAADTRARSPSSSRSASMRARITSARSRGRSPKGSGPVLTKTAFAR